MSQILNTRMPEHLIARRAAMRRETTIQIVAISLAVVSLVLAGFLIGPVNRIRQERQLVIDPDTIKGLPPNLALIGKLGTFRALVIDWASIRAERLKDEGKTYEALQLHETVCALAPRFPTVWVNAAWNMAYNISVMQYSPEARWQWVRNGIEILRDQGIQYNPKAVALYKELAYIYWHKIGDFLDDDHLNYKRALAVQMERVLGAPPIALTDEDYFDWFRKIVNAPRDLDEMRRSDSQVNDLITRLGLVDLYPDESVLEFVARYLRPGFRVAGLIKGGVKHDVLTQRRLELLTDPDIAEPVDRLLAAVRSQVLRERYKFDLDFMLSLMVDNFGPLDWRNAFAHTLYWSSRGDELSRGHQNLSVFDQRNNARFIVYSLQNLVLKGRITLWPDWDDTFSSYIELTPDTRYISYLYDTYMRLGKEHFGDDPKYREGTPGPVYMTGFVSNMQNWIELLYLEGGERNVALAEEYYAWLRDNNPHPDGTTQRQYVGTLDEFVIEGALARLGTYKAAGSFIRSLIQRGLKQFALGVVRGGITSLRRARHSYDYWMVDTKGDYNERRKMQPFVIILRDEVESYMQNQRYAPLYKAMLWRNLLRNSPEVNQLAYDHMLPYFERLCEVQDPPWDVNVAFEEPPAMEEFRKREIQYRGAPRQEGVDAGEKYRD